MRLRRAIQPCYTPFSNMERRFSVVRAVWVMLVMFCVMFQVSGVSPAHAQQPEDTRIPKDFWALPGASIIDYNIDDPENPTFTVRYRPADNSVLFYEYISGSPYLLDNLLNAEEDVTLNYGAPAVVDLNALADAAAAASAAAGAPAGGGGAPYPVNFYLVNERTEICAYAEVKNRFGVKTWRVSLAMDVRELFNPQSSSNMCDIFSGGPQSCADIENCLSPCDGPNCRNYGECCVSDRDTMTIKDVRNHCVSVSVPSIGAAVPLPIDQVMANGMIPEACFTLEDEPPQSQLQGLYSNYQSIIGRAAFCLETSILSMFLGYGYDEADIIANGVTGDTIASRTRESFKNFVAGVMAIAIILFAYDYMFGERKTLQDLRKAQLFILKLILVWYFAAADGTDLVFRYAWPMSKQLAGIIVVSAIDGTAATSTGGGGTGTGATGGTAPDPAGLDLKNTAEGRDLFGDATNYLNILGSAREKLSFYEKLEEDFDEKKQLIDNACPDVTPEGRGASLFTRMSSLPTFMRTSAIDAAAGTTTGGSGDENNPPDFWHCGVMRSCNLNVVNQDNRKTFLWNLKKPEGNEQGGLVTSGKVPPRFAKGLCEQNILEGNVGEQLKDQPQYLYSHGGDLGAAFKELRRKTEELTEAYLLYAGALELINNHNLIIYYYKTVVQMLEGDTGLRVVKSDLDTVNSTIQTLEEQINNTRGDLKDAEGTATVCTGADADAQEFIRNRNQAEAAIENLENNRIKGVEQEIERLQQQTPRSDTYADELLTLQDRLGDLQDELNDERTKYTAAVNELTALGCYDEAVVNPLLEEIEDAEEELARWKAIKADLTEQDYTIQLGMANVSARLEKRLAVTQRKYSGYHKQLYCALNDIDPVDCVSSAGNAPVICLEHMGLFSTVAVADSAALQNDVYLNAVLQNRQQCPATAANGLMIGEGIENVGDILAPDIVSRNVYANMFEVNPWLREKVFRSAAAIEWLGGSVKDPQEALATIPLDDEPYLAAGESSSIAENDTALYTATDADTAVNPYMSYSDGTIELTLSEYSKAINIQPINTPFGVMPNNPDIIPVIDAAELLVVDVSDTDDYTGQVDYAMFKYCMALFGSAIAPEEATQYSFGDDTISEMMTNLGIHGCQYYYDDETTFPKFSAAEKGLLDEVAELDLLCPATTPDKRPYRTSKSWDFPQSMLNKGAGLDGLPRTYYSCTAPGGGAAAPDPDALTANLATAFADLENLFGNDAKSFPTQMCLASTYRNCINKGLDFAQCNTNNNITASISERGDNGIDISLLAIQEKKYQFDSVQMAPILELRAGTPLGSAAPLASSAGIGSASPQFLGTSTGGKTYGHCGSIKDAEMSSFLIWDYLDCKLLGYLGVDLRKVTGVADGLMEAERMPKWILLVFFGLSPFAGVIYTLAMMVLTSLISITMRLFAFYMNALITIASLVFLAPVFVPMVLMDTTKGFFSSWMGNLLGALLQPILLATGFVVVFFIIDIGYFGGNVDFNASNRIETSGGGGGGVWDSICNLGGVMGDYADGCTVGAQLDMTIFILFLQFFPILIYPDVLGMLYMIGLIKLQLMLFVASMVLDVLSDMSGNLVQIYRAGKSPVILTDKDGSAPSQAALTAGSYNKRLGATKQKMQRGGLAGSWGNEFWRKRAGGRSVASKSAGKAYTAGKGTAKAGGKLIGKPLSYAGKRLGFIRKDDS